jgi:WD40 repeat protein
MSGYARRPPAAPPPAALRAAAVPLSRSAAQSHRRNDAYIAEFEAGLRHLGASGAAVHESELEPAPGALTTEPLAASPHTAPAPVVVVPSRQWLRGPVDPAGVLLDLSDRPVVCAAAAFGAGSGAGVVLGCTDHASYVVDARTATLAATLFGRACGHGEWVTGVVVLGDGSGRVATCGMDGRVLLWEGAQVAGVTASQVAAGRPVGSGSARRGGGGGSTALISRQTALPPSSAKAWRGAVVELPGHFGSVSLVLSPQPPTPQPPTTPDGGGAGGGSSSSAAAAHPLGHLLVSAGYDKTLRVWDAGCATVRAAARGPPGKMAPAPDACVAVLRGHAAPVLCAALQPSDGSSSGGRRLVVASGDRDGVVRVWCLQPSSASPDGSSSNGAALGCASITLAGHGGHVTALAWARPTDRDGWVLLSGAQDGCVRVWRLPAVYSGAAGSPAGGGDDDGDATASCVQVLPLHASKSGTGAVNEIAVTTVPDGGGGSGGGGVRTIVVTAGADKTLAVVDATVSGAWVVRHRLTEHADFIYSLAVHGHLALSGGGDGTLLCQDVTTGKPLWGLGANAAAARTITVACGGDRLVVAGDDGKAIVYDFSGGGGGGV